MQRLLLLSIVGTSTISSGIACAGGATQKGMGVMTMSAASTSPTEVPFVAETKAAVAKMITRMNVRPSGDANGDFVAMMVPHHQGAIDLAEAELRYGRNKQLMRLAQQIIVEELQEMAAMRTAIDEVVSSHDTLLTAAKKASAPHSPKGEKKVAHSRRAEAPFIATSNSAMDRMVSGMTVTLSGDVDHEFVAMMVPHHVGAIEMAEAELRYNRDGDSKLRLIAQEIIVDQMQEITLMRLAVGETLPPSASSPTSDDPARAGK